MQRIKVVRKDIKKFEGSLYPYTTRLHMQLQYEQDNKIIYNLEMNPSFELHAINGAPVARYKPLAVFDIPCQNKPSGIIRTVLDYNNYADKMHMHLKHFFTAEYGIDVVDVEQYYCLDRSFKRPAKIKSWKE
jgi:hypothetical protein